MIAFLDTFGGSEMLLIMVVILIFFGGDKMPGFARGLGKALREFKKAANEVEQEFKHMIDESERQAPPPPPKPPANVSPAPSPLPPSRLSPPPEKSEDQHPG